MAISASFLWRFLDDVWDLLPAEDRELFQAYWSAKIQVVSNIEQKVLEASLSQEVLRVPTYLTERWNRFVMDDGACDLFTATETVTLTGLAASSFGRETAFYHTAKVTLPGGQISASESMQFLDNEPRSLRYSNVVPGTVSIKLGTFEFTQNRDYAINPVTGTVQALPNGRLPFDDVVAISYQHYWYEADVDYVIDEINDTITRTSSSSIPSGTDVSVSYTYNATPTLNMEGTNGVVGFASLVDEDQNFSTLLPNRTLTIASGPNAGTYEINGVLGTNEIQIVGSFPLPQTEVSYSINAFPHGQRVNSAIASIPVLQDLVDDPTHVLLEGVDYRVQSGILATNSAFRLSELGPTNDRVPAMWAEVTRIDAETPYRNFGVLIDFYRENSDAYKQALQGLWYAFWTGSTPGNKQRGLHILLGLPYARKAGTVTLLDTDAGTLEITDAKGATLVYTIPDGLVPTVAEGDDVARFASLTNGVEIIDRNNTPGFVTTELGRAGIEKYLTSRASRGTGLTDETRALELLEHHLFVPRVLIDAVQGVINLSELTTFLDNIKPAWTDYVLAFNSEGSDSFTVADEEPEIDVELNLTTTVTSNEWNRTILLDSYPVDSSTGEIISGGTQATGNFQDTLSNFGPAGADIRPGDIIRILSGNYLGDHIVLERISNTVLSLDIPDAEIVGTLAIPYFAIPALRGLDHDTVHLKREHIRLAGTEFQTPSGLNTKTDAAFLELRDEDVLNLLLVDAGNSGAEVQPITDADVAAGEIEVATPPAVAVQDHEVASAALVRTLASVVTDAYAI